MGRKKKIDKLTDEELKQDLSPQEQAFLVHVRAGRKDPVYFAEKMLGVSLHPKQKVWLWLTSRTQFEKAYELGLSLKLWDGPAAFEKFKSHPFQKNILVPSNRWGKTLVTSVKHLWYNYYKIGVR